MHELVRGHPGYGYWRMWALPVMEGWHVNRKPIWRLWQGEGFKVPRKQRKKRPLGHWANGLVRGRPEHQEHIWCWDFIHDRGGQGRRLKWLSLVRKYTRECLALEVERWLRAVDLIDILAQVMLIRGLPQLLGSDNGPQFIAHEIRRYLETAGVGRLYIAPASPWENGYAGSFFSRLGDELLERELFADLREAKVLAAAWQSEYNHHRPRSAFGYRPPAAFAARCNTEEPWGLRPQTPGFCP